MADLGPLWLSLQVATAATVLIVLAGSPAAWCLARLNFRARGCWRGCWCCRWSCRPRCWAIFCFRSSRAEPGWANGSSGPSVSCWSFTGREPSWPRPSRRFRSFSCRPAALSRPWTRHSRMWRGCSGERALGLLVGHPALAWRGLAAGTVLAFARALGDFGATMMVAGNIPGLTQTARWPSTTPCRRATRPGPAGLRLAISLVSIAAILARAADRSRPGGRPLSAEPPVLDVRLVRRIHAGLTIDVALSPGDGDRRALRALRIGQDLDPPADHRTVRPGAGSMRLGMTPALRREPAASTSRFAAGGSA